MESERLPTSAITGMAFGCCAWSVLLTVFFFAFGAPESALQIGLPCVALSVGFVALILVALQGVSELLGFRSGPWKETLFGLLLYFMGVMLLLANTWIGPAMERAHMVTDGHDPIIGISYVPAFVPLVCLAVGTVLLVRVAMGVRRATAT